MTSNDWRGSKAGRLGIVNERFRREGKLAKEYLVIYTLPEVRNMRTAKLFQNGRSQAVRLPKEFNFNGEDVFVQKVGESVILFPKDRVWETFLDGLYGFTDDFLSEGREQPEMQEREGFLIGNKEFVE